jgi:hypothetical protein
MVPFHRSQIEPAFRERFVLTFCGRATICAVSAFLNFGSHLMIWLFFIGLAGSSVVIVLSFVEDLTELFGD